MTRKGNGASIDAIKGKFDVLFSPRSPRQHRDIWTRTSVLCCWTAKSFSSDIPRLLTAIRHEKPNSRRDKRAVTMAQHYYLAFVVCSFYVKVW